MERLTERTADGILVKEDYGEAVLKTLYQCYGKEPMPHYANCDEGYCAMEKLAEYEDLEEQGKLLKLPCAVGDTVYRVKSRDIHNRKEYSVDEKVVQSVEQIVNTMQTGNFGKIVFLTREEAEAALKEL